MDQASIVTEMKVLPEIDANYEVDRRINFIKKQLLESGAKQDESVSGAELEVGKYYIIELDYRDPPKSFADGLPRIYEVDPSQ